MLSGYEFILNNGIIASRRDHKMQYTNATEDQEKYLPGNTFFGHYEQNINISSRMYSPIEHDPDT